MIQRLIGGRFLLQLEAIDSKKFDNYDISFECFDLTLGVKSDISTLNIVVAEFCEDHIEQFTQVEGGDAFNDMLTVFFNIDEKYWLDALCEDIEAGAWEARIRKDDSCYKLWKALKHAGTLPTA